MPRFRSRSGNATLSKTFIESKSAAPWKTIPNIRRASVSSRPSSFGISTPSTRTLPRSGRRRPMTCFMSTVFPEPEPPRTTNVVPFSTLRADALQHLVRAEGLPHVLDLDHRPPPVVSRVKA